MPAARTKRQRIVDDLTAQIGDGRLRPGQKLPSSPELEVTYQTSTATVRAAMTLLKAAGLVEFTPGVGMFVA